MEKFWGKKNPAKWIWTNSISMQHQHRCYAHCCRTQCCFVIDHSIVVGHSIAMQYINIVVGQCCYAISTLLPLFMMLLQAHGKTVVFYATMLPTIYPSTNHNADDCSVTAMPIITLRTNTKYNNNTDLECCITYTVFVINSFNKEHTPNRNCSFPLSFSATINRWVSSWL